MYPAPFELHRPSDISAALDLLQRYGDDAKLLAGGHSLLPTMKLRLAQPAHLIDLSAIEELRRIDFEDGVLAIGAMATHWQVQSSERVRQHVPLLSTVAGGIADSQVRNRGTIGGSIVHADPAADYPAAMLATQARIVCVGPAGARTVEVDDWFVDLMATALQEGEVVTQVRIPEAAKGSLAAYVKHKHPASRFAMPGVAVSLAFGHDRRCVAAYVGLTGASHVPRRAKSTESRLIGAVCDAETLQAASDLADADIDVGPGFQVDEAGMRTLLRTVTRRSLEIACAAAAR